MRPFRAFTMVEMLIVVVMIALLMAITVPLLGAIARRGAIDSAQNALSAALGTARAIALRDGRDSAVVIYHDDAPGGTNATFLRVCVRNDDPGTTGTYTMPPNFLFGSGRPDMGFKVYEDRPPERLPNQIRIAGPDIDSASTSSTLQWRLPGMVDENGAFDSNTSTPAVADPIPTFLCIWFGPDGQVRTSTPIGGSRNIYIDNNSGTANQIDAQDKVLTPIPFLVIYDRRDMSDSPPPNGGNDAGEEDNLSFAPRNDWINASSPALPQPRVLMFNQYSGTLMRRN